MILNNRFREHLMRKKETLNTEGRVLMPDVLMAMTKGEEAAV